MFREISMPFVYRDVFPVELKEALVNYFVNPPASTFSDAELSRLLSAYDKESGSVFLEALPAKSLFRIHNGKTFKKMEKIRTNYRCYCLENKKYYTVRPNARVRPVAEKDEYI
jgi:hypothetical protein